MKIQSIDAARIASLMATGLSNGWVMQNLFADDISVRNFNLGETVDFKMTDRSGSAYVSDPAVSINKILGVRFWRRASGRVSPMDIVTKVFITNANDQVTAVQLD